MLLWQVRRQLLQHARPLQHGDQQLGLEHLVQPWALHEGVREQDCICCHKSRAQAHKQWPKSAACDAARLSASPPHALRGGRRLTSSSKRGRPPAPPPPPPAAASCCSSDAASAVGSGLRLEAAARAVAALSAALRRLTRATTSTTTTPPKALKGWRPRSHRCQAKPRSCPLPPPASCTPLPPTRSPQGHGEVVGPLHRRRRRAPTSPSPSSSCSSCRGYWRGGRRRRRHRRRRSGRVHVGWVQLSIDGLVEPGHQGCVLLWLGLLQPAR